jgi:hypothetical protein
LTICPAGDRTFSVLVKDVNNAALPGRTVVIDLSGCANAVIALCQDCPEAANYNSLLRTITRITDANGMARFQLCGSIFCPGTANWAEVSADGVILAFSTFVTTDLDGDLDVDAQDVGIVTAAQGGSLPEADEDCSGGIDGADVALVGAHVGHMCPGVIPAFTTSWGRMKSTYR